MMKKTLSEKKRKSIVDAAIEEFKENGFQGTSMDKISARADVSKRTVYNHFPSKEILFTQITEDLWRKGRQAVESVYQPDQPLRAQLHAIAQQQVNLLCSEYYIGLSRMVVAEYLYSPNLAQQVMSRLAESEAGLKTWLECAIKDGRLNTDTAEFAAQQFLSLLKTFTFWPQVIGHAPIPSDESLRRVTESAVAMFLTYYENTVSENTVSENTSSKNTSSKNKTSENTAS